MRPQVSFIVNLYNELAQTPRRSLGQTRTNMHAIGVVLRENHFTFTMDRGQNIAAVKWHHKVCDLSD
jgi:hypothetical protein